jgi:hypothetical protein
MGGVLGIIIPQNLAELEFLAYLELELNQKAPNFCARYLFSCRAMLSCTVLSLYALIMCPEP